jgi:hypothetical protein
VQILEKEASQKKNLLEVYPSFKVLRSKDLMIRGKAFYAVWDAVAGLWSTDEFDIQRLIDNLIRQYEVTTPGIFDVYRKYLGNWETNSWMTWRNYVGHLENHFHQLDEKVTFLNSDVKKEDYVTKRLPYDLTPGDISAWDEIVGTLYDDEQRRKIEWTIGSVITGDSKSIQKCLVFYGDPGTGKGTIINIIQWMFDGYWEAFSAKELTGANNSFALEAFKMNPLLGIDHDGDLSKITDNTKFNSMVSHEPIQINEKNKPLYTARFDTFFIIGSNSPIRFTDSRSGLIRRVIDVQPTGALISPRKYQALMNQIKFELGAIAAHCRDVYLSLGKDYYSGYRPIEMMLQTDVFFNFIEDNYDVFKSQDGITLNQAWAMYQEFIKESGVEYKLAKHKLRDELKSYFENFEERAVVNGDRLRSYFSGFKADRFKSPTGKKEQQHMFSLVMEETESLLDRELATYPAQYSKEDGSPRLYWDDSERMLPNPRTREMELRRPESHQIVNTKLKDLDTKQEHYVKVPHNHIVIDFDLKDADGKKSAERNLEAASQWPPTYAEFSKSGDGIHLHYNYTGDPEELSAIYSDGIEVKVYTGNSSLRRRLSMCNNVPIADISSGLPLKEKKVMNEKQIEDEKHLRALINKALRKEVHPGTKSNVDFIHKVLEDYYVSGKPYNVTDMRNRILSFAALSTNQNLQAMKMVQTMKFASEEVIEKLEEAEAAGDLPDTFKSQKTLDAEKEVIFDVEVFPNLFVIVWGYKDSPREENVVMINPSPQDVGKLMSMKLVGYNCRRYDNHILYGAYMGYNNEQLYKLSKKIIDGVPGALFGQAFDLSFTDIYDFSTDKKGLKKWQLELGIKHVENNHPWDEPVPKEKWPEIVEYCQNDVETTKIVRKHLEADFIARQILSDLSGLSMNTSTNQHTSKIIFGEERKPQGKFVYTNLSEMFPGYKHDSGKSTYREEITGEGGYVYSEPGIYKDVAVLDVASMHPTSIEQLNLFGEYTEKFSDIKKARVAIKRKNFDEAKKMLGGKLARHLNDPAQAKALSNALKIAINSVYGLTSARFENSFKDPRNIDNIVAKRGALFMIDLKHAVQEKGFQVVHIKTDSIKIPNATPEIIQFVMDFGTKYGYEFEHEETFSKFCLVNDAVYVAQIGWTPDGEHVGEWETTGAQFQHPYVKKYLFTREPITFDDMCETKSANTSIFLDYNGLDDTPMAFSNDLNSNHMKFVGKVGKFTPVLPGAGGGILLRQDKTDLEKFSAVTGTKGWFWMESAMVETLKLESEIDGSYYERLVNEAVEQIKKYTNDILTYEWFVDADNKPLRMAA